MASSKARYLSLLAKDLTSTGQVPNTNVILSDTGVTAGSYGSASLVPVLAIDSKGRVTSASNTTVVGVTSFGYNTANGRLTIGVPGPSSFTADVTLAPFTTTNLVEGSNLYYTDTRTRNALSAGTGVTYNSSNGVISIGQAVSISSDVTFANLNASGNVVIDGNLTVSGTTVTINATNLAIEDNMIYLNEGSTITNPDLGISGNYNDGTYKHTGVFRDATDDRWKFFKGYTPEPGSSIDITHASFALSDVQAATFIGALSGNATTASAWQNARTLSFTGDATGSMSVDGSANASAALTLANSGVSAATYNNVTVNAKGLVTSGSNVAYLTAESDTLATVTGRGASTSTAVTLSSMGNQFGGHFYFLAYDAAGNHYPHFNDGGNASGSKVNWRLYTGGTNSVTHYWGTDTTQFATKLESTVRVDAPIFYDRNDTAYYLDSASTSNLNTVVASNTYIRSGNQLHVRYDSSDSYRATLTWHGLQLGNNGDNYILAGRTNANGRLNIYVNSISDFGTITGTHSARFDSDGRFYSYVDTRSPNFYDSDDTSYYVNPNGTSRLSELRVGSGPGGSTVGNLYIQGNNNWRWIAGFAPDYGVGNGFGLYSDSLGYYLMSLSTSGNWYFGENNHNSSYRVSINGTGYASGDFRAPIFYDSADTTYYLDPAGSTSLNVNGYILSQGTGGNKGAVLGNLQVGYSAYYNTIQTPTVDTVWLQYAHSGNVGLVYGGGSVGIGNVSPTALLHLLKSTSNTTVYIDNSSTTNYSLIQLKNTGASGRGYEIGVGGSGTESSYAGNLYFYDLTAGSARMVLTSAGNFGIGTTSPSAKLHVEDGSIFVGNFSDYASGTPSAIGTFNGYQLKFDNTYAGSGYAPKIIMHDNGSSWLGGFGISSNDVDYFSGGNHRFFTATSNSSNGTERFTVLSGGNVGVGIASPVAALDVASGGISVSGWSNNNSGSAGGVEFGWDGSQTVLQSYDRVNGVYKPIALNGSYTTVSNSTRSPIFYDSDNTSYYVDPASGSNLYGTLVNSAGTTMTGGWNRNLYLSSTFPVIVFNSNSQKYSGIGVDYSVNSGGMVFWSNGSSADISGTGTVNMQIYTDNFVQASGSFRAPIFYDSADTNYYADMNAGTSLKYLRVNGDWAGSPFGSGHETFTITGTYASFVQRQTNGNQTYALHHISDAYWLYIGRGNTNGSDWNWALKALPNQDGNHVEFRTSARAPIFYDSNDTGYYIDPTSTSDSALRMRGGALFGPNTTWSAYLMVGGDGRQNYINNTTTASVSTTNGNLHLDSASGFSSYINWYDGNDILIGAGDSSTENGRFYNAGYLQMRESVRAPIFYDSNDTGYYVNPADGGFVLRGGTSNRVTYSTNDSGFLVQNPEGVGGNVRLGAAWGRLGIYNSSYLMLGSEDYIEFRTQNVQRGYMDNGANLYAFGSMRSPIFYDHDDTSYQADLNGYSRLNRLVLSNTRVDGNEKFPVGHYSSGETVFEIDPSWSNDQLQAYFNSANVSWVADSTAPGGYAISIVGYVNVGGEYQSGFPYIPVEQDDVFYMECWLKDVSGTNYHYMGSMDYNHNLSSLGGNPGSYGYWVMLSNNPGTSWTKYASYIGGFGESIGQFETGTKYWTPQALFNYSGGGTTYISGWKVTKVNQRGRKIIQATGLSGGTSTTYQLQIQNSAGASTAPDLTFGADGSYAYIQSWNSKPLLVNNQGNYTQFTDVRAPVFYDSNDTNFKIDPTSTSKLEWLNVRRLAVNPDGNTSDAVTGTLSLWSNPDGTTSTLMFKRTDQIYGTHGAVTDQYATFWNMDTTNRGWIFRNASTNQNVFSISNNGGTVTIGNGGFTPGSAFARLNVHAGSNSATLFRDIDLFGGWSGGEGHAITATHGTTSSDIVGQMVFQHDSPGSRIKWGRIYHSGNQSTYPMELISNGSNARLEIASGSDVVIGQSGISYSTHDNTPVVGGAATTNRLHVNGSIQLTNNDDAFVVGRSAASFFKDEEIGFGWGGGWYMIDSTWVRVRNNKDVYTGSQMRADGGMIAPIYYDLNDTSWYADPNSISRLKHIDHFSNYGYFRGANRATNDWEYSGLSTNPTVNDYSDGSWYVQSNASDWNRGLLSHARYRRVEGLTFEYEVYITSGSYAMIGFTGGDSTGYGYGQTPANLTYHYNAGLTTYTNGSDTGSDYSFNHQDAWWKYKIVLMGRGARHYVYRNGEWNLIKSVSTNDQNSYEWVRILVSFYTGSINWRDVKVYVDNNHYRGLEYRSNFAGIVKAATDVRAPIFSDLDNTNYYIDPAATGTAGNFNGTVNAVIFNTTSDARLKENIEPITDALDKVNKLNGVTYNFKNDKEKRHAGLIAQEVLEVLPEAVSGSEDDTYKLSYSDMTALLLEAIKEQQKIINIQSDRITKLEQIISDIKGD